MLKLNRISTDVKYDHLPQYFHELLHCISGNLNIGPKFKDILQMSKIRKLSCKKSDFDMKGNSEFLENESTKILDLGHDIYRMNGRNKSFPNSLPVNLPLSLK